MHTTRRSLLAGAAGAAATPLATVVAFEDPSCRQCRRFETETFPTLKSELVDPGDAAFVYRTLDITFPWGEPASQVMASTYAAADAFWGLKDYYYERQPEFEVDNVFELSASYLEEQPSVDADAVVAAARDGEHDEFVQRNRDAAEEAGVGSTPQFFLFRDGTFRTEVAGPQDYEVFESALGFDA
ncbi:disulfide bond formation protein DsbA [Halobacteriales archaeon QH_10_70_21]|nr:MAG: disulfide bond formation protein DsbA [Halobacteriales archaeon QH_10_70_21]